MSGDESAIFVAIDDNHHVWYEMLVPFILSLRNTDYRGHVVVLDYGLSERKRAILQDEGIEVAPTVPGRDMSYGRYCEVARICAANPRLAWAALYDADIWFCAATFDLFEYVRDGRLHVCRDPMFSSFIDLPLVGPRREENLRKVHDDIIARYGGALQAGVVAGRTAAWAEFAAYLDACAERIGTDFQRCFGIDTTFLHLWAAEHEVGLLPQTQNFITKLGVTEVFRPGRRHPTWLAPSGETIRALHMCGDVRFFDRWRYYTNHCHQALEAGAPFALADGTTAPLPETHPLHGSAATELLAATGLRLVGGEAEDPGDQAIRVFRSGAGLFLHACGNHRIALEAIRDIPLIDLVVSHPAGLPSPVHRIVSIAGQDTFASHQLSTKLTLILARGAPLTLRAASLGGQACEATWILSEPGGPRR